jgi:hypothetical protein
MNLDLKVDIIKWLSNNENEFNRVNACVEYFREYIYDKNGNYLKYNCGRKIHDFIVNADKLLFEEEE